MATNINKELAEKEIENFLDALEMDLEAMDHDVEYTDESGNKVMVNGKDNIFKILSSSIMRGRLVFDSESITAKYTFRKPLISKDLEIPSLTFKTDNCQAGLIKSAKQEIKNKKRFAGVMLFAEELVTPNVLEKMSQSEENTLISLAQLFFEY